MNWSEIIIVYLHLTIRSM